MVNRRRKLDVLRTCGSAALLVLPALGGGCADDGRTTGGNLSDAGRRHYYVDVTSGRMITAQTVGLDPIMVRSPSAVAEPPRMPERTTLAATRQREDAAAEALARIALPGELDGQAQRDAMAGRDQAVARADSEASTSPAAGTQSARTEIAPPPQPAGAFARAPEAAVGPQFVWTILLRSVTGANHRPTADAAALAFADHVPQLRRGIWVHSTGSGSMVLYGRFQSVDDAEAQQDLQWLKDLDVQGQKPYAAAYLARVRITAETGQIHAHDLRTARRTHPGVDPLYTVEVAAWMAPENDDREWAACRRAAESYVQQLRALGHEAYFYHNESKRMTSVTIGAFPHNAAYNEQSGLTTPAVRRIVEQFPRKMVNGEEFIDPDTRRPQTPHLSHVPK